MSKFVHPLFIPKGIFDSTLEINYGVNNREKGININPCFSSLSKSSDSPDLSQLISEIPHFWKHRIKKINYDPSIHKTSFPLISKKNLYAFKYYEYVNKFLLDNKIILFMITITRKFLFIF